MTSSLQGLRLGDYTVNGKISKGARGCVFLGQRSAADLNLLRSSGERKQDQGPAAAPSCVFTAVKYPANNREVRTMRALLTAPACMGVPLIFDSGLHGGKPWLAMELLGSPLAELIKDLRIRAPKQRWMCICVLGHLLLRRLRAIHERGFVHCDINDTNIMIGRKYGTAIDRYMPFFVDFGLAHPHPGGDPIQAHAGTIEFNSIRSTDGGPRLPRDDVEAVGWLLCYAFLGNLFWFRWIEEINWKDKPRRAVVCKRVQQAKLDLMGEGPKSFEAMCPTLPAELAKYLRLCRSFGGDLDAGQAAQPDYEGLARLLGGWDLGGEERDREDIVLFGRLLEGACVELPSGPAQRAAGADACPGGRPAALLESGGRAAADKPLDAQKPRSEGLKH